MLQKIEMKYKAFLSYSHKDTRAAKRLHKRLEHFKIDKDLRGRETEMGQVPNSLRPIFRDREDFTAGHSLTDQTLAALDASPALIVICSPNAAQSHYVNEEIRLFKFRHPDRPVIPVIVAGEPGTDFECFPPALRFELSLAGTVTTEPIEVLAADIRESGDGENLALAKVVARLLDLGTDDVYRRAQRAQKRATNIRNSIIAVLALLVVAATGSAVYAWQQLKTNEAFLTATLKRATGIVNTAVAQAEKYNIPRTATLALLTQAEGMFDDMAKLGRVTPELQREKAVMLIQFARNYEILGDTTKQRQHAEEAKKIMAALAASNKNDLRAQRDLSVAHNDRGDVQKAQGDLKGALASFKAALAIAERLAHSDPANTVWQRDLSVSYNKIGDVQKVQGDLKEALASYKASHDIFEQLAKSDPANAGWQFDLVFSHRNIGKVLHAQGKLSAALEEFEHSRDIARKLVSIDQKNANWSWEYAVAFSYVGTALMDQGRLKQAQVSQEESRDRLLTLAKSDPQNAGWQRDLSVSHNKIGDVQVAQGDLKGAFASYKASHDIFEQLAKSDPANAGWVADLAASHGKFGQLQNTMGNKKEALALFKKGRAIVAPLAQSSGHQLWKGYLRSFDREIAALENE